MFINLNLPELIFLHDSMSVYAREENNTLANLSSISSIGAPYDLILKIADGILDLVGDEDIYDADRKKEIALELNENELWIMSEISKSTVRQGGVDGLQLKLKTVRALSIEHKNLNIDIIAQGEDKNYDTKTRMEEWKKLQEGGQ